MLVPAAIGNVINKETAEHIEARYVVEAANGPTTPEGDAVLRKRGITVLPDIYTNGGKWSTAVILASTLPLHSDMTSARRVISNAPLTLLSLLCKV